jgi:hypothetical protein
MGLQNLFPTATTVGNAGLFSDPSTYGLVQGGAYPDPSTRWRLRAGIIAAGETTPMWGGCAVFADVPGGTGAPRVALGPQIGKATTVTGGSKPIAGWSVFDQAYNFVSSPSSNAPQAQAGMTANYYPIGSLARIIVACDPALADQQGDGVFAGASLAWDFNDQILVPYTGSLAISSGTYVSGTGVITLTMGVDPGVSPGDSVTLSSLTGSGAYASLDGTWEVIAGTTGDTVVLQGPVGVGAAAITGGNLTTGAALSTLPTTIQLLDVQTSNCVTVDYTASSGATNWQFSGACAVLQI